MGPVVTIDEKCGCHVVNATQCSPTRQFVSFCPLHASAPEMNVALQKIVRCDTRFGDSTNCVEVMLSIARKALEEPTR